jgi:hypothetical protein
MTNPLPRIARYQLPDLLPDLASLTRASGSCLATLSIGLAVGLPISAAAETRDADDEPTRPTWARWLDPNAEKPPEWMGEHMYFKKGTGLEYRRETKLGSSPVEVGLQGPLLRKKKDPSGFADPSRQGGRRMSGVGMAVEVRF